MVMKKKLLSKDLIAMSLYELLYKGIPLEKISVTELCQKANVSRMSFYRTFNNVQDVIISYCDDRFEEFFKIISVKKLDIEQLIYEIFAFIKRYKRQFILLSNNNLQTMLIDQLYYYVKYVANTIAPKADSKVEVIAKNKFFNAFVSGGLYMIIDQWTKNQMEESVEEVTQEIFEMFNYFKN